MTQEEKAKAYDEALEKAKDTLQKSSAKDAAKTFVYHFFPELKESEDEIIRKELIRLFNDTVWNDSSFRFYDLDKEKVIAWLEKQDKQKLTWSEEDEEAIEMAIIALEDMYDEDEPDTTYGGYNLPFDKAAERLKSLKERIGE